MRHTLRTRLLLGTILFGCVCCLMVRISRGPLPALPVDVQTPADKRSNFPERRAEAMPSLQGTQARVYLQQQGEYQSLMEAVTAARFGLKHYDVDPVNNNPASGYLGMSHVQNLNVWFDRNGATIRPTLSDNEKDKSWRLNMRLKAYGYGDQLVRAPAIVSQTVRDNRIEYERKDLPIDDCQLSI